MALTLPTCRRVRRRGASRRLAFVGIATIAASLGLVASPGTGRAQSAEGAVFLLVPIGARAVATGGAVSAAGRGSENVWWNPATIARDTLREIAIHHAQTFIATSDAIVFAIPWRRVGVVGVAANLFDLGTQDETPPGGGPPIGSFVLRNVVASLTLARPFGRRVDVGVTYKLVQLRIDCSGQCSTVPVDAATTSAVDAGVRVALHGWAPITVGAAVRNAGPSLRLPDSDIREPLPTRWQAGVLYEVPGVERYAPDVEVRLAGDVVSPVDEVNPGLRVGAEATWQRRVALRGGYVFRDGGATAGATGPTVGLGLVAGRLMVDIAREFQGLSVDAGQPPTYVSLRYQF